MHDRGKIMICHPTDCKAAIGSSKPNTTAGSVNIYGGEVMVEGGAYAAGIGGGYCSDGGYFTIFGGTVIATGIFGGAGIGGGQNGDGCFVTIFGGSVNAMNESYGAGIGSGESTNEKMLFGGTVYIYGGSVNATGGDYSNGIGGDRYSFGTTIRISGGDVTATGGIDASAFGIGNNGNLMLVSIMALKAGHDAPDTKMTTEEYYQVGYRYANVYEDILAKGENWYITGKGVLYITGAVGNPSTTEDYTPWKEYKSQITAVVAKEGASVTNCARLFSNCANLTSVDIKKLNITGTKDMKYMFSGCSALEALDLSGLDTSAVASMMCLFYNDSKLNSINLDGWNTKTVYDMQYMFRNCAAIKTLNLSSFDTSKVTSMNAMFYDCTNIETLDISNFNGDKLSDTDFILGRCYALLDITVNGNILQKLADPIIGVSSIWYYNDIGQKYTSADELKAIEGKVTLSKTFVQVPDEILLDVEGNNFSVTLKGSDAKTGVVIVGVFDNDKFLEAKLFDISKNEKPQGSFEGNGKVRAFWWSDLETLIPMCECVEK